MNPKRTIGPNWHRAPINEIIAIVIACFSNPARVLAPFLCVLLVAVGSGHAQQPVPVTAHSCQEFQDYVSTHGLPIAPGEYPVVGITVPGFSKTFPAAPFVSAKQAWKCIPTGGIFDNFGKCNEVCPSGLGHVGPVCPPVSSQCASVDMSAARITVDPKSQMWVWAFPANVVEQERCYSEVRRYEEKAASNEQDHIVDAVAAASQADNMLVEQGVLQECAENEEKAKQAVDVRVAQLMEEAYQEAISAYNQSVPFWDAPSNGSAPLHSLPLLNCSLCP